MDFSTEKDTLFDVFELPECKYLHSVGTKGGGPNEFIFPIANSIQASEEGFTILDNNALKTVKLLPDNSLYSSSEKTFDKLPVNGFSKLNDSLICAFAFCATGINGEHEYRMKNRFSNIEKTFGDYPDLSRKKYTGDERCQIYYKYLVACPAGNKFAAFYSYFKFFRIYNIAGNLEKEVYVNIEPYKAENLDDWQKRLVHYWTPVATEKYIYAPCYSNDDENEPEKFEIQVWDWNGNPIIRYSLDREVSAFTVSDKEKKLYATSDMIMDRIYVFNLCHE